MRLSKLSKVWIFFLSALCGPTAAESVVLVEGDWVVADPVANAIYRIDSTTFDVDEISSGAEFRFPSGVASSAGALYVTDPDANALIRVDPSDGSQSIASQDGFFRYPTGVSVASNGDLLVADPVAGEVIRVVPSDGAQSIEFSTAGFRADLHEEANSVVFAADPVANAILQIDPSIPSEFVFSSGGVSRYPTGVVADASFDLLVIDPDLDAIIRVDRNSGSQTLELDGTGLIYATGITVVPEPAAAPLVAAGGVLVAALARRRGLRIRVVRRDRFAARE
jgi:streptogramin lyase